MSRTACCLMGMLLAVSGGGCVARRACPTHKLAFTQATGCHNDGSVEFCLPKDPQLAARLRALAPELQGPMGSRGRAGCDLAREELYFFPTRTGIECVQTSSALTEEAWTRLCRVAEDPAVSRIVPTWFE